MKQFHKQLLVVLVAQLLHPVAEAATSIKGSVKNLGSGAVVSMGTGVKGKSWYDPDAPQSGKGWTHNSKWGYFKGTSGQTYTITIKSSNTNLHPGITIWSRNNLVDKAGTSTGSIYVHDHLYPQRASFSELTAVDSDVNPNDAVTGFAMIPQAWGYDADGTGNKSIKTLHPIEDGVSGQLKFTFTAAETGHYLIVVGGINPSATFTGTGFVPVTVQVETTSCHVD